jgi:uncharacterized repeat protein (TIGR01451 family)
MATSITVDDGVSSVVPGTSNTYTIVVSNSGPAAVTGAAVNDLLPIAGVTGASWAFASSTLGGSVSSGSPTTGTSSLATAVDLPVGATVTFSFTVDVDPSATGDLVNAAMVSAPGEPTFVATDTDTLTPEADLAITKMVSNSTPNVGDAITFTVTLSDQGPSAATGVQVTDLLPAGLTFVSATSSQGTYDNITRIWDVGTVSPGVPPQTLIITARVVSPAAETNTGTVNSPAGVTDPNPANNTASATETPQQADLVVAKQVSNPTPNVGDQITFTVTLSDQGPDNATNVVVADLLPVGLTFVSATPSQGTYSSGVWTVGTVSTSVPQTLSIIAKVVSPGTQTNTAAISHADQFDPDTANNSASATETPQQANLSVSKSVSNATPNVGDTITFTVNLSDLGPDVATNVVVSDLLPAGLTFVSATPSQGNYDPSSGFGRSARSAPGARRR